MAADDEMMIDSISDEERPPLKRAKFVHIIPTKKRLERDISDVDSLDMKRARKSMPNHDRPEFFHTDVVSKRRKLYADLGLHSKPKPKPRSLARRKPLRGSRPLPKENIVDDYPSSPHEDATARASSDISQSDDIEEAVSQPVPDDDETRRQNELRRKAAEQELLEKLMEDRIRQHRDEEDHRCRLAERKSNIQSRVHEEIRRRAAGKSPAQLLFEFCGIKCSAHSQDSLKKAFRRALAQVHPDRMQQKPLEQIVEAEEIYKLLQPIYCDL